jgi:hypothetical protein
LKMGTERKKDFEVKYNSGGLISCTLSFDCGFINQL